MGFYAVPDLPPHLRLGDARSSDGRRSRKEFLARVDGEILEIGFGTGLNLPHYPEHVRRIITVDPNPGMNASRAGSGRAQRHRGGSSDARRRGATLRG